MSCPKNGFINSSASSVFLRTYSRFLSEMVFSTDWKITRKVINPLKSFGLVIIIPPDIKYWQNRTKIITYKFPNDQAFHSKVLVLLLEKMFEIEHAPSNLQTNKLGQIDVKKGWNWSELLILYNKKNPPGWIGKTLCSHWSSIQLINY